MNTNKYEIIPLEKLPGKKYFQWFDHYDMPTYGMTVEMDVTAFYHHVKENKLPLYLSLIYLVNEALNQVKELRYRIVDGQIALFDHIDPSFTVMTDLGNYDNVNDVKIRSGFQDYLKDAARIVGPIKAGTNLAKEAADDCVDQFYITCVPWLSFKSLTHPMDKGPASYVPRVAWDKIRTVGDRMVVDLNIVVNHAFVDGFPLSQGFLKVQEYLNKPEVILK